MALTIAAGNTVEFEITRRSIFIEVRGLFSLFATLDIPRGSPRWVWSRHEEGTGAMLIVGPLMLDAQAG